jgi:hypothetical protein
MKGEANPSVSGGALSRFGDFCARTGACLSPFSRFTSALALSRDACWIKGSEIAVNIKSALSLDLPPFLTQGVSRNSTRNFRDGNKLQI